MVRDYTMSTVCSGHRAVLACLVIGTFAISLSNVIIGHLAYNLSSLYQPEEFNRGLSTFERITNLDGEIIYDGEYISHILDGELPFPVNNNLKRLKFRPGSLPLSSAQSLQKCYINSTRYGNQIPDKTVMLASVSDTHKLIYRNIPKSSSSTARHAMKDFFDGNDRRVKHDELELAVHQLDYALISFVRDPLNRFYSSFDESFFRLGPWMGSGPIVADKPRVKKWYFENKYKVEKYPYLYEGLPTIGHFRKVYCPPDELSISPLACNDVPSIENGTLAHRFERFVRDYDGREPFDVHMNLQVSNLVWGVTGNPLPVTKLYNATEADKGWLDIAHEKGVHIPDGQLTHGRRITRRFNVSKVSDATKRKICRLMALDYCCLNFELPEVCRTADDDEAVFCALDKIPKREGDKIDIFDELVIQQLNF
mmetsp:Transcript_24845/g.49508  ORF Transcript_24845/g.49508 Transcript_24845/m.49508 type:complete len:424 (-) Transcript_24845:3-1274(-)